MRLCLVAFGKVLAREGGRVAYRDDVVDVGCFSESPSRKEHHYYTIHSTYSVAASLLISHWKWGWGLVR